MFWKRFFPTRWARITVWTAAAITWVASGVATNLAATAGEPSEGPDTPLPATAGSTILAAMPAVPEKGLVIVRYTPAPPPPAQTVTVYADGGGGGGGSSAPAPAATSGAS